MGVPNGMFYSFSTVFHGRCECIFGKRGVGCHDVKVNSEHICIEFSARLMNAGGGG